MNIGGRVLAAGIAACLAFGVTGAEPVMAAETSELPGMTYEALRDLPDWSGWWGYKGPNPGIELVRNPQSLRAEPLDRLQAALANPDSDPDPGKYCRPPQFVGLSGNGLFNLEILFTPGRVTTTNEAGLIRRIYTDGRPLPEDPDETNTGSSVGRWVGQTLIVETVGIRPDAKFPSYLTPGAMPIGEGAKITERISLSDENTLEFEVVIVAPAIFTAPYQRKHSFGRAQQPPREASFCADFDRSIDPVTGKQRFDATPPDDLPPPPSATTAIQ